MKMGETGVQMADQRSVVGVPPHLLEHENIIVRIRKMTSDESKSFVDILTPVQRNSPAVKSQNLQSNIFHFRYRLSRLDDHRWTKAEEDKWQNENSGGKPHIHCSSNEGLKPWLEW